jgi:hypothetical protein
MDGLGATVLRAGAVLLAAGAFVGANAYVIGHPKNGAAPLQPPAVAVRTATPRPTAVPRITLQPGVRATELPGITYTHVS